MIIVLAAVGLTLLAIAISILAYTTTWAENTCRTMCCFSAYPYFLLILIITSLPQVLSTYVRTRRGHLPKPTFPLLLLQHFGCGLAAVG